MTITRELWDEALAALAEAQPKTYRAPVRLVTAAEMRAALDLFEQEAARLPAAQPVQHQWADLAAACERACRTMQPPQEDEVRNLGWWAAEWRRRAVARKLCRQWTWRGQG